MAVMGYAAISIGMAALTVATGGASLIALGTVAAGVGAMSLGASEVIGGVTGYNPMRVAMGDQTYNDSMMLATMGSMVGMQYSGQYYQMYGGEKVQSQTTVVMQSSNKTDAIRGINDLPFEIQSNIKRFFRGGSNSYTDFTVTKTKGGDYTAQMTKPGNVPGSYAIYIKNINSHGQTINTYKTTYDPMGNIVHIKNK